MIFHHAITRRGLLAGVATAAFAPGVTRSAARAASVGSGLRLLVERRTIEVDGRAASVFGIRQPDGTPGLVLDPGQPNQIDGCGPDCQGRRYDLWDFATAWAQNGNLAVRVAYPMK